MMKAFRCNCTLLAAIAGCALGAGAVHAQTYPTKPVRIIVPFAPGGASDMIGRVVAQHLTKRLGQSVIVDNHAGAGGAIGVTNAARSAPDGYTLLLGTAESFGIADALGIKLSYDANKDFTPIALVTRVPSVFVVNNKVPAKTLKEFVTLAKAQPGKLHFGSPGVGTNIHLIGEMFKSRYKLDMTHVPYKGGSQALTDLIGGQIEIMPSAVAASIARIKDGTLRPLAITSEARSSQLPDVPTMAEAGVPDFVVGGWFGILAPATTPTPVVKRLEKELEAMGSDPEFKDRMAFIGGEGSVLTGTKFAEFIQHETERWRAVVKTADIKPE